MHPLASLAFMQGSVVEFVAEVWRHIFHIICFLKNGPQISRKILFERILAEFIAKRAQRAWGVGQRHHVIGGRLRAPGPHPRAPCGLAQFCGRRGSRVVCSPRSSSRTADSPHSSPSRGRSSLRPRSGLDARRRSTCQRHPTPLCSMSRFRFFG